MPAAQVVWLQGFEFCHRPEFRENTVQCDKIPNSDTRCLSASLQNKAILTASGDIIREL
jgi:hypothetical protein